MSEIKQLPVDEADEKAILASVLLDHRASDTILDNLYTDLFYYSINRVVYHAINELQHTKTINPTTADIYTYIKEHNQAYLKSNGNHIGVHLSQLLDHPVAINWQATVKRLAKLDLARKFIVSLNKTLDKLYTPGSDNEFAIVLHNLQAEIGTVYSKVVDATGISFKPTTLAEEVREWVVNTTQEFVITDVYNRLQLSTRKDKQNVSVILGRLKKDGIIESVGKREGRYRRVLTDFEVIDFDKISTSYLDIAYPLGIHRYFRTLPKNVIVIAGSSNAGKSAFLLRFASMNMGKGMPIRYLTSEMGGMELKSRLEKFEFPVSDWKGVEFIERSSAYQDLILPDGINIIDYLEIGDQFWLISTMIRSMFDKLRNGILLIAIQKRKGAELGRGADFGEEKPRLYLSMDYDTCKIVKIKNWADPDFNPNGLVCNFKIYRGWDMATIGDWGRGK